MTASATTTLRDTHLPSLAASKGTSIQSDGKPVDSVKYSLRIAIPDPAAAANDAPLVSAVVRLANVVFLEAEVGIWTQGFYRTTEEQVTRMLKGGELALAYLRAESGHGPLAPSADDFANPEGQQLVGCISIKQHSPTKAFLNMLALDKRYQGLGLARDLMAFAERRCVEMGVSTVGLDLLYPTAFVHPLKARMQAWYLRLGYEIVRLSNFAEDYPDHAPLLAGPVEFRVFEKRLC